jgi:hypothetical protein
MDDAQVMFSEEFQDPLDIGDDHLLDAIESVAALLIFPLLFQEVSQACRPASRAIL